MKTLVNIQAGDYINYKGSAVTVQSVTSIQDDGYGHIIAVVVLSNSQSVTLQSKDTILSSWDVTGGDVISVWIHS